MKKSIVLLSGGMDSAVAFYWAHEHTDVRAVVNFAYGQLGAQYEFAAARALHQAMFGVVLDVPHGVPPLMAMNVLLPTPSPLTGVGGLEPDLLDEHGQPSTFVPGRNLIFIAYATSVAYAVDADMIIGGWNAIDVDYPDCTPGFLNAASAAATLAIGREVAIDLDPNAPSLNKYGLTVYSPVVRLTKMETVKLGESLGVPWGLTRSCYDAGPEPCLYCDSCRKRVEAFIEAGVEDPTVMQSWHCGDWDDFVVEWQDARE